MSPIEILLKFILGSYFSTSRCIVLINDEFDNLNFKINIPVLSLHIKNEKWFQNLYDYIGCQDLIINVNSPVTIFSFIEQDIQLHQDRFNKRKYIIVPKENQTENSFDILNSNEILHVSDLLIITSNKTTGRGVKNIKNYILKEQQFIYNFWTHQYVGEKNNEAYLLDMWFSTNKSFLYNHNLFPNKLLNQMGRILKTAVFPYEPYIIVEPQKDGTYLYMGTDMMTLFYFAKHYNMTIMPVINVLDYWGQIWDNWTGNGLLGNLIEDKADIGAAALYTWEYTYKFLDLSKPTVRTGITCLVPAPKMAAGWMTPVYVYTPSTWMAVMGTFLISLSTLYFLGILQKLIETDLTSNKKIVKDKTRIFGKALLAVTKPFIMQNVTNNEMFKGYLGRYLMGLVYITTLVLSITYDSGLATIMTIPRYENPINTVEDFVNSGLNWGATQDAWVFSIQNATEPNLIKVVSRFKATSEENLRKLSLTGNFAFSLERLPNGDFAVGSYIQEDVIQNFHLMTEDIYWEQCVFMLRKNSILLPYIDIYVLRVFEAGLISVWQNQAVTQYMNRIVQKAVRFYQNQKQKPSDIVKLKIAHVQGAFGILVFGNGFALMVFLIELFYIRM